MTTETLFLIAHVVRGAPAFDVAIQMVVRDEDEPWWILPSTGHRAYPYWSVELRELDYEGAYRTEGIFGSVPSIPEGWPDFYRQPTTPITDPDERRKTMSVLEALGLAEPFVRRV